MLRDHTSQLVEESRRAPQHWELLRALGAAVLTPPPGNAEICRGLDLPVPDGAEHTGVFVLGAPPHAAIHLGPEGKLGGEGLDRVAGFWRALGLRAPEDADHLGALLMLYAELGGAESSTADVEHADHLRRSRCALLHEHIWSWAPAYLVAVQGLGIDPIGQWADLTLQVLRSEHDTADLPDQLPLALREAPEPLTATGTVDDALDALVAPVRTGMVLTQRDLQEGARLAAVGFRRGERRFALRAMLEQDPVATLDWLLGQAHRWADVHRRCGDDPTSRWWQQRAAHTAATLEQMLAGARS
ncbi:molecular chaperone TorD family protein [Leekyejoonella antrihumi]|nr:molecular chaperone TorD family protein [Leekyejoonella antrihumi]